MNWISVEGFEHPHEGELVFITGVGPQGRFYADAQYEQGGWLMFDQEADEYIVPCGGPDHWQRIIPPGEGDA